MVFYFPDRAPSEDRYGGFDQFPGSLTTDGEGKFQFSFKLISMIGTYIATMLSVFNMIIH